MASHRKTRRGTTGTQATPAEIARLRAALRRATTGAQVTPAEAAKFRAAISGTKKKKTSKKKTKR